MAFKSRPGSRKYQCEECHQTFMASPRVHYRSYRVTLREKCPHCGSLSIAPYSRQAKHDIVEEREACMEAKRVGERESLTMVIARRRGRFVKTL